jgi:hypothetical protein
MCMQAIRCGGKKLWILTTAVFLGSLTTGWAQGTTSPTILLTGAGSPLITETRTLSTSDGAGELRLQLEVGFSTEEFIQSGTFADSYTLTLESEDNSLAPILCFTMDIAGVVWAPPTPGAFPFSADSIIRTNIPFPSVNPDLPNRIAYLIELPIPQVFRGNDLNFHFDLFDNGNSSRSLAWFREAVIVPEPSGLWLFLIVALIAPFVRRRSR